MSISKEVAEQMQARVNALKLRYKQRSLENGTTVGEMPERGSRAAAVWPRCKKTPDCVVGIDPGTHTGMATLSNGALVAIETTTVYSALKRIENLKICFDNAGKDIFVRFEDARLRKWFGFKKKNKGIFGEQLEQTGSERYKGAGSIMRDCAIWEETLTELGIPFEKVAPKEVKETTSEQFQKLTGWKGRTSIHAREAAWLVLPFLRTKNT